MRNALTAEWIKIRSTRTLWALLTGAVAVVALSTFSTASTVEAGGLGRPLTEQDVFFLVATNLSLFAVVVGVRSFTDEFRHGTVVYSLLSTPSRTRLVLAKAVAAAAGAAILAAVAQAAMLLILAALAAGAGVPLSLDGSDAAALAGLTLACAGWAPSYAIRSLPSSALSCGCSSWRTSEPRSSATPAASCQARPLSPWRGRQSPPTCFR